jgi:hypothetical protein
VLVLGAIAQQLRLQPPLLLRALFCGFLCCVLLMLPLMSLHDAAAGRPPCRPRHQV